MKTKHTHTQGPWHVGAGNGEGSIFADNGRTRLEIGGTTLYPIAKMGRGWNEEEDEANARLIAAAPELLAALKDAEAMLFLLGKEHEETGGIEYNADFISGTRNDLLLAIAKAEGGGEP